MLSNNISESSFSISTCTYFLGITALKPESRQNLRKFKLFRRIFHPGSDNGCHWHLHTALWNIWWIINEPCGQFDLWLLALIALFFTSNIFFFFFFFYIFAQSSHLLAQTKVQVHDQIFFAKDCMPCNRLCRNCSCYWSIFRRCLSLNKGLPL